jgi:uncharacterized protein YndB with AHSA1/START domain
MKSEVKITDDRLQMTRVFNAPRHIVFGWWSEAEKLQQWSGCKETTRCEIRMDFRVGGSFTQTMQIAGAGEFTFTGTYDEIVVPERIAYHADFGQFTTRIVVEFIEQGNGTKIVLVQDGFPDEFHCKTVSQGTSEAWEKLASLLPAESLAAQP